MLTGNGQRAPHREDGEERRREERWLLQTLNSAGEQPSRLGAQSDEHEMGCPNNKRCLRPRQSLSEESAITSSYFATSSDSRCVLCAVYPHYHLTRSIPFFRTFTSGSEYTSTPTPTSSLSATPTSQSQSSTLFSTDLSTSSPSFSTTTPPPSSSSEPPSSSTPSTSPSSGFVFSTFTSSFVSEINGSPTTASFPLHIFHTISFSFLFFFFLTSRA
jgi:hypothetical protein